MTPEQADKLIPKDNTAGFSQEQISAIEKYSVHGAFNEPVVRCDSCAELVLAATLKELGMCPHCSNTRVKNVRTLPEKDMEKVKGWVDQGLVDPEWLFLFSPREAIL